MKIYSFEKLDVYVEARVLVGEVYKLLCHFPDLERYALSSQIRRAVISVTSNIAEGTSRTSNKDKAHFMEIAYGSLIEVVSQLQIAVDMNYITKEQYENIRKSIENVSYKLFVLRKSFIGQK